MQSVITWIKDNSLSLSMFALFVGFLFADSATGLHNYDSSQAAQGYPQLGYLQYIRSGAFLDGLFVNWQAAILQLTTLIVFSEFMSQRGAAHSRKPKDEQRGHGGGQRGEGGSDRKREKRGAQDEKRTWWQATWLYRNSLSLAFVLLFAISFVLHVIFGAQADNHQRALRHQPPISLATFAISAKMWTDTFETWEAEFFVMGLFLVASIYLRQEYSAESKALGASINDTGEPNE